MSTSMEQALASALENAPTVEEQSKKKPAAKKPATKKPSTRKPKAEEVASEKSVTKKTSTHKKKVEEAVEVTEDIKKMSDEELDAAIAALMVSAEVDTPKEVTSKEKDDRPIPYSRRNKVVDGRPPRSVYHGENRGRPKDGKKGFLNVTLHMGKVPEEILHNRMIDGVRQPYVTTIENFSAQETLHTVLGELYGCIADETPFDYTVENTIRRDNETVSVKRDVAMTKEDLGQAIAVQCVLTELRRIHMESRDPTMTNVHISGCEKLHERLLAVLLGAHNCNVEFHKGKRPEGVRVFKIRQHSLLGSRPRRNKED